jgi:hypothetical protein
MSGGRRMMARPEMPRERIRRLRRLERVARQRAAMRAALRMAVDAVGYSACLALLAACVVLAMFL